MLLQDTESFHAVNQQRGLAMMGAGLLVDEGLGQRFLVVAGASLIMLTVLDCGTGGQPMGRTYQKEGRRSNRR